ncbi:MAG TPA: ECF-type sigma factor [Pirellulales bacterium]
MTAIFWDPSGSRAQSAISRPQQRRNLRYFAGFTLEQAASALRISPATADRQWAYARAWLHPRVVGAAKRLACVDDRPTIFLRLG